MKTLKVLFATAFATMLLLASCTMYTSKELGPKKTQKYDLKNFTALDVSSLDKVTFVLDSIYSVEITAPEKLMEKLTVSVSADSTLKIYHPESKNFLRIGSGVNTENGKPMSEAVIHAPALKAVSVGGFVYFETPSPLESPSFAVALAGSGTIKIPSVTCETFEGKIAGSGFIGVDSVRCNDFSAKIAGSGDMRAKVSQATTSRLKIAGSGNMAVDFDHCRSAIVTIAGSGDVNLRGTLGTLQPEVAGSGDINTSGLQLNAYNPQPSNP